MKHRAHSSEAYEITLRYGRSIKVTGDHSIFVRGPDGLPTPKPVREFRERESVAIAAELPVPETDVSTVRMSDRLLEAEQADLWDYAVHHPWLQTVLEQRRTELLDVLARSGRFGGACLKNTIGSEYRKYRIQRFLPLYVIIRLGCGVPAGARVRIHKRSAHNT
jgi:hypothetical protein